MQDRSAGRGSLSSAEGDDGVDFPRFLKLKEELGRSGDDERIGLLAVGFDEEFVKVSSTGGNDFLLSNVGFEFGIPYKGKVNEKGLASEGFDFRAHEIGFGSFSIEGGKNCDNHWKRPTYRLKIGNVKR